MPPTPAGAQTDDARSAARSRRGMALAVIVACQALILIDEMLVNIALPGIATELRLGPVALSWVLNAYLIPFGGLLLFGGRLGDILGRRRVFLIGLGLFTAACLARGLAPTGGALIAARVVQGVGAAIATPCVLSLIINMFREGPERKRAIAVNTAVSGVAAAAGLVIAGALASIGSWRWVLMANVPMGVVLLALVPLLIRETRREAGSADVAGTATSALGLAALAYVLVNVQGSGWRTLPVQICAAAAVVLLALFVLIQRKVSDPLIPYRLFADRVRLAAVAAVFLVQGAQIGQLFFLTQFFQQLLGFAPLVAAGALFPVAVTLMAGSALAVHIEPRIGARPLVVLGGALLLVANLLLSRLGVDADYAVDVLPALLVFGTGVALCTVTAMGAATGRVETGGRGAVSSVINAMQSVGASVGLAVIIAFATHAGNRAAAALPVSAGGTEQAAQAAMVGGMSAGFQVGAVFALLTAITGLFLHTEN